MNRHDISGEIFLFPHTPIRLGDIWSEKEQDALEPYFRIVDPEFNKNNSLLAEVWITVGCSASDESITKPITANGPVGQWYSMNLRSHGMSLRDTDGSEYWRHTKLSWLPVSVLRNLKEGDSIDISIPIIEYVSSDDPKKNFEIVDDGLYDFRLRTNQLGSRYPHHGRFEEMLSEIESWTE